uniref:Uncharacterized protein LOC114348106 isoform X1 n=1 Tax=Diabrotica virgifera virgifera TaxID=50390 RepID=A0A6P7GXR6_DIAVI
MRADLSSDLALAKNLHLQCDGWSNIQKKSIVSFVISKPEPIFVEFLATEENKHTGNYFGRKMSEIIEKYNSEKFLVVIGDNAANMKQAFTLMTEKYDHLVPLGCLCHTLQLLCNDIVNCKSAQTFFNSCTEIVKCQKNVHILNALFTKINKEKNITVSLKLPVKTRWVVYLILYKAFLLARAHCKH